ncbi:MAG: flagellar biosynthesis protein FlgM [Hyphomicrobiales bacterium]|nr:zinc metallopeptidase [Hyphomicrobiales bacterium]PCJ95176.1 MAG: flagellar biosynthesis protein FlgM [Hyphomicrobiales bacterium]
MRWKGRRQSSNVDDRRGSSRNAGFRFPRRRASTGRRMRLPSGGSGRKAGGGGIALIVIVGVAWFVFGINPITLLGGLTGDGGGISTPQFDNSTSRPPPSAKAQDEMKQFVTTVLAETEDTWNTIFERSNRNYEEPRLVLFTGQVRSACGFASAASGPFYCPGDKQVYIDLSFYDELRKRFDAPGDFAQAYVLAHEVGHHVQNLLGVLPKFNKARRGMSKEDANAMSVRVELQADCYAGVWGYNAREEGLLERGDLDEALNAATQIGDDAIQKRTQGYVVPETFSHGTSEQRKYWFQRGFDSGNPRDCDTFED